MQRVLITGGAGFIGSALCRELSGQGHEVFVVDDLSFGRRELAPVDDAHFHRVDIRDRTAVMDVLHDTKNKATKLHGDFHPCCISIDIMPSRWQAMGCSMRVWPLFSRTDRWKRSTS